MTRVKTYTHARLVCDEVNDLMQLREFPTNGITLTTHVLDHCSKCANVSE